jgi:GDPmannose 4,6-dehydratase
VNPRSKVIVTGVQGQDGSILCEILVNLGYDVIGIGRRRLDDFSARDVFLRKLSELNTPSGSFKYAICDLRDSTSVHNLIITIKPQTVFNLAAMSSPAESWDNPAGTLSNDTHAVVNILDAIKNLSQETRLVQACTAAIFHSSNTRINEQSAIKIVNPYAAAKFAAFAICDQYRTRYGIHVSNAIMFNHESVWRPEAFVTRKISKAVAAISLGSKKKLNLWTLDPIRDWGWAQEYMQALELISKLKEPRDMILATGTGVSLREYVEYCFNLVNLNYLEHIQVDPNGLNTGVDISVGDPTLANQTLGWKATTLWKEIAGKMVAHDISILE